MMLASKSQNTECLLLWFGSLLIALANCSLQGAPCYNDDGKIIKGDVACNPDAEQSFCCGEYWTCLDSGVCSDQNTTQFIGSAETLLARATCTDRTYSSSTCPQFCLGNLGRGITLSDTNSSFCCQQDLNQPCNADPNIKNLELGTPFTTVSLDASTSSPTSKTSAATKITTTSSAKTSRRAGTSSASASLAVAAETTTQKAPSAVASAATPTPTPPSPGLSEGAKIGVAVGVTVVAVSVIAALLFFWYRRRERHKSAGETAPEASVSDVHRTEKDYYAPDYSGMGHAPQEMGESRGNYTAALRGELATDSQNPRAEMSDPAGQKLAGDQRRPLELP